MTAGFFSLLALLVLVGCAQVKTTSPGIVGVDRPPYMAFSADKLNQSIGTSYGQIMQNSSKKKTLNLDAAMVKRVRAIANRLIPHTRAFRSDAPGWQWEVNVISSDELNAFCATGGKIALYSGIIEKLSLTDDEIAAIMGHEIAHALREHSRERASLRLGAQLGVTLVGMAAGANKSQVDLADDMSRLFYLLPNSREHETEADRMGVELAARRLRSACSEIGMAQNAGNGRLADAAIPEPPSHQTRIIDLETYSARAMFLYEAEAAKPKRVPG